VVLYGDVLYYSIRRGVIWLSFVIDGKFYTGCSGDGYKEAAQKLYNEGKSTFDPYSSNVDPTNARYIQAELDKLQGVKKNLW
jgi:hypothetical protein